MKIKKLVLNILTVSLSLLIALGLCQLALVATGWSPQKTASEYLQFGYSTGIPVWDEDGVVEDAQPVRVKLFQQDSELFWKAIPGTEFTNAQGFRGERDIAVENSGNSVRILILGDSCSFLGEKLYADYLQERLSEGSPATSFEIINASVPGYTSFQGRQLLPSLLKYRPHYAIIYFGWNDHWILPSGYSDQFHYDLIHSARIVQLARIWLARLTDMRDYRVPLDSYRENLAAMVAELKANNVVPVLIAAPAGYSPQGMPKWAYEFYRQYYRMTADEITAIPSIHAAYAEMVSRVAKDFGAVYVDMQGYFGRQPAPLKDYFRNDLIHLKDRGHQVMADGIYEQIKAYNLQHDLRW